MIKIGNKTIGPGQPCFVAAEIGINHNGDMNLAFQMIDSALAAGADAVKFQNYYTEDFVLDKKITYSYSSQNREVVETQFDMFKRYELNADQIKTLKEYCDKKGIIFFSTPTSERGINDLVQINCPLLKNGSDLLVNLEIIEAMAKTRIPTIISTGIATLAEIDDAVRHFEKAGGVELIILHCCSTYPTPPDQVNLNKIQSLQKAFNYPIGFSDHTNGVTAALGSVILGACFIEKHFTLDKSLPGPDHHFSSDKNELKTLINEIRTIEKNLGSSKIGPTKSEEISRKNFRLSCVASKNLFKGQQLTRNDIAFSRPSGGLPPKMSQYLIGQKINNDISVGNWILFENIS